MDDFFKDLNIKIERVVNCILVDDVLIPIIVDEKVYQEKIMKGD